VATAMAFELKDRLGQLKHSVSSLRVVRGKEGA